MSSFFNQEPELLQLFSVFSVHFNHVRCIPLFGKQESLQESREGFRIISVDENSELQAPRVRGFAMLFDSLQNHWNQTWNHGSQTGIKPDISSGKDALLPITVIKTCI